MASRASVIAVKALCAAALALVGWSSFGIEPAAASQPRGLDLTPGMVRVPSVPLTASTSDVRTVAPTEVPPVRMHRSRVYRTPDRQRIRIAVSASYDADRDADQNLANYLGSLVHGSEMDGLRISILSPDEIAGRCGVHAAACYFPSHDLMVIVGESQIGGLPTEYVIAHEYGHRIAQFRRNPPFPGGAFWFGTKRWASEMRVCPALRRGQLSIERNSYWNFPGEIFAESYASLHQPDLVRWQFSPLLQPTASGAEAIRSDVLEPWRRPAARRYSGRVRTGIPASLPIRTDLDGRLVTDVRLTPPMPFTVTLVNRGTRARAVSSLTGSARLSHVVCGERRFSLRLKVAASPRSGPVAYRVSVAAP